MTTLIRGRRERANGRKRGGASGSTVHYQVDIQSEIYTNALMISEDLGALNRAERDILAAAVRSAGKNPQIVEVGTWLGGGSTATFLECLKESRAGHLWGIEASKPVFDQMCKTINGEPGLGTYFTPVLGFSQKVIPRLLNEGKKFQIAFLDGGNNPFEQIEEFALLDPTLEVGSVIFSHDAKLRKGKWFVPYIQALDNWKVTVHDVSDEGILEAKKVRAQTSESSAKSASQLLRKLRLNPVEIIGGILPSRACEIILKMIPSKLARSLAEGRK